jgi:tetratricopeptide (TPR) repeat protein
MVMSSGKTEVATALDLLNRSLALDPAYAPAMGGAAVGHYLFAIYGWSDDPDGHGRQAVELAHRALKASGDDALVLTQVALPIADLEGDLETAVALADRALDLNPGSAMAWALSGALRVRTGNADLAGEHLETSIRLDPLGTSRPMRSALLASARFTQGRFAEAVALSKEYLQQAESPFSYAFLAASHARLGQTGPAAAALARYRSLTPQPIDVFARAVLRDPTYVALFLDGIALAEGKPPDAAGTPP